MARPRKQGLDYFPLNTDFFQDIKIRKLIKRYSSEAAIVYIALLQYIYKEKGYYLKITDDIPFYISEQTGVEEDKVATFISGCISVELFDSSLFASDKILTSKSIQTRYISIISGSSRVQKTIPEGKYNLLGKENSQKEKNQVSEEENSVLQPGNSISEEENSVLNEKVSGKHNKVNKIKENKIKDIYIDNSEKNSTPFIENSPTLLDIQFDINKEVEAIQNIWNASISSSKLDNKLSKITKMPDWRKKKVKQRILEFKEIGEPQELFSLLVKKCIESDFLTKQWKVTFDWIFQNEKNWLKIYEGNYDNYKPSINENSRTNPATQRSRIESTATSWKDYSDKF